MTTASSENQLTTENVKPWHAKKRIRCKNGTPEIERLFTKIVIDFETGCWIWQGGKTMNGYATHSANTGNGAKSVMAYRHSYRIFRGEIPVGLTCDHLCRRRDCVNPYHLELVTQFVNNMRGESVCAKHARQTHCKHGHEFTAENIYSWGGRKGRACLACRNEASRLQTLRLKESRPPFKPPTHCKRGHEFSAENTRLVWKPERNKTQRLCIACDRLRMERFKNIKPNALENQQPSVGSSSMSLSRAG